MKKLLTSKWLWGVFLFFTTLFFYFTSSGIETLELKFYDFRQKINSDEKKKNEIAIINIDDESISRIGRWPWSRDKISDMLLWLSSAPARPSIIGLNILFSEKEKNKGIDLAQKVKQEYVKLKKEKKLREKKNTNFVEYIDQIAEELDSDKKLSSAIRQAQNIVLPMFFATGNLMAKPQKAPQWVKKFALKPLSRGNYLIEASDIISPLEIFASSAVGIGHVNVFTESDGTVRQEYPFISYDGEFYPSFAFEMVRNHLKRSTDEIKIGKNTVRIGKFHLQLSEAYSMLVSFNGSNAFNTYSFYDVINGKVVPEAFAGKIVLIGITAQGLGSLYVTPIVKNMPAVNFTANIIENILHSNFIVRPPWAFQLELGLILLAAAFIIFLLPRLKALTGAIISGLLLASFVGVGIYFFLSAGQWIKTMYPSFLLVAGYIVIVSIRFFTTERKKEVIEMSAIETNKMLGLSFQGQGMLDLAFEKFRLCPLDEPLMDLLYNLALDFERKRQYNKAVAVYEHIAAKNQKYKDIATKIELLKKAADGAVFAGSSVGQSKESTILVEGASTTPTLGRYEVLKELGKGAMGIVYLGRDPKINRTVAIKTMRFEEGIEEKELAALKNRFFREAQAAGNLSHPNIVKIYDAGEEQDIAYMAMEFLKGDDLKKHTKKDNLLSLTKVTEYIIKAADALDYAHKNGVIHRDIKPANIMLLEDGSIRVADFGIARIQESSKTATGTVLGTPYYMSPEQIAGKKVDGRADIFSLGVTLFELLTGEKPWKGGEAIATLFFQITSEPYPDPLKIRPELPKSFLPVIDKALKKNPGERYQTAGEMAEDLKKILFQLKNPQTKKEDFKTDSGASSPKPPAKAVPATRLSTQAAEGKQKPALTSVPPLKNLQTETAPKIQPKFSAPSEPSRKTENPQSFVPGKEQIQKEPPHPFKMQDDVTSPALKPESKKPETKQAETKTQQPLHEKLQKPAPDSRGPKTENKIQPPALNQVKKEAPPASNQKRPAAETQKGASLFPQTLTPPEKKEKKPDKPASFSPQPLINPKEGASPPPLHWRGSSPPPSEDESELPPATLSENRTVPSPEKQIPANLSQKSQIPPDEKKGKKFGEDANGQLPINETLAQPLNDKNKEDRRSPSKNISSEEENKVEDFEKTLPLIDPEEENDEFKN